VDTTKRPVGTEGRSVKTPEAAIITGYSESTLEKKRLYGGGPPFIKLSDGSGAVVYDVRDLETWMAGRRRMSTADRPPSPALQRKPARKIAAPPAPARKGRRRPR
jgi:hypothetical protein